MLHRLGVGVLPRLAGAGAVAGTVALLPEGTWAVRPDGARISGRVDLGELLGLSPVVLIVRERG